MKTRYVLLALLSVLVFLAADSQTSQDFGPSFFGSAEGNSQQMIKQGRHTFRFEIFRDEDFWGGQLKLHETINHLTPRKALELGLKVDSQALPPAVLDAIKMGKVNLNDPTVTLLLIKLKAVLGVVGFFNQNGTLKSVGLTCAVCHSTVDNSIAPSIGKRIDGLANRDLNVGAIAASAPNLQPVVDLLRLADPGITADKVRAVLNSWGPGKFDAELFLDGKAFNPQQVTNGVVTGQNVPGATLIPPAFGLAGVNLHTWTGWGSITHWNALVANLEMHGKGTFFDPRLDDPVKFPIAAREGFGHIHADEDQIPPLLPALHVFQLTLEPPTAPHGS